MKLNTVYVLSLALVGLFSTANAARAPVAKAAAPKPASPKPSPRTEVVTSGRPPASTARPNAPAPSGANGEGLPNGSPTDTGCIDGCGVYPPPAPDGNTANSLEVYYLAWFPSYKAAETMNMSFWSAYNPAASGPLPTTINIDLYDQFGKINLGGIAQNVAVKASTTPFILQAWKIPATVSATFNVSNQFMIVFSGANNWRRDRLIQIDGITANPGGGPNPAYANVVSGQVPLSVSGSGVPNPSGTGTIPGSTNSPSTAASARSDLWVVVCVWTFVVAQVVGFVLV